MVAIKNKKKELEIEMDQPMPPHLNKNDNCYQYELIVVLFNSRGVCMAHNKHATKWFE
jgi:hypothetical protein